MRWLFFPLPISPSLALNPHYQLCLRSAARDLQRSYRCASSPSALPPCRAGSPRAGAKDALCCACLKFIARFFVASAAAETIRKSSGCKLTVNVFFFVFFRSRKRFNAGGDAAAPWKTNCTRHPRLKVCLQTAMSR